MRHGTAASAALVTALMLAAAGGGAAQAAQLSEAQARAKAAAILKGDPYGATTVAAARTLKAARLAADGKTKVCAKRRPAWEFHVVVVTPNKDQFNAGVIDGYLALDARTGKVLCHNLPLLD